MHTPPDKAISPAFAIGAVVYTASIDTLARQGIFEPLQYLYRHICGDWGDICEEDQQGNRDALELSNRLLSSYQVQPDLKSGSSPRQTEGWPRSCFPTNTDASLNGLFLGRFFRRSDHRITMPHDCGYSPISLCQQLRRRITFSSRTTTPDSGPTITGDASIAPSTPCWLTVNAPVSRYCGHRRRSPMHPNCGQTRRITAFAAAGPNPSTTPTVSAAA